MTLASAAFGVLVLAIVIVLLFAVQGQRDRSDRVRAAGDRALAANQLRQLVVDLQTGQRGFLLTGDRNFLEPFEVARAHWRADGDELVDDLERGGLLVGARIDSLIADYLEPTIRDARTDPEGVLAKVRAGLGQQRVDAIVERLEAIIGDARAARSAALDDLEHAEFEAVRIASIGVGLAALIIIAFSTYLTRAIVIPVRRLGHAAQKVAAGQLGARVRRPESARGELAEMASAFNSMADSLEQRTAALETAHADLGKRYDEIHGEVGRAAGLQRRLLPDAPPERDDVLLGGLCLPAADIGGDYFDYVTGPDGRVTLIIADVAGHGVGSALLMTMIRHVVRREVEAGSAPADVLAHANAELFADFAAVELFVTAFCARICTQEHRIDYAGAGHNPPLLRRADGTVEELAAGGVAIGFLPLVEVTQGATPFRAGDAIVLYTDGVVEAADPEGRPLGDEALRTLVRRRGAEEPQELVERVIGLVRGHVGDGVIQDDVTVVAARRPG